ncbi:MAG: tetratricopeptide repeat protein [Alphaproteobacteria bacterium]|nr:tetratricopeptide repeat protein [Alphaproteobacteria bacterium]
MERRLTTILAADVVGYSRLMAADEPGTLDALKAHRTEVMDPKTAAYGGRVVKLMGDGTLMEFASVVDAVNFAVEVQRAIAERNADIPEGQRTEFRIGINIGDVLVEGDDIYGDGVNVAARLEGLADPGGICVSGTVYEHTHAKLDLAFEDLGVQEVKNIAEPLHVYRILSGTPSRAADQSRGPTPPRLEQAWGSIAVFPFDSLSPDPDDAYLADGIASEIINMLSRISDLRVASRSAMFASRDQGGDIWQLVQELQFRYVLTGSVRHAGDRVRVIAELTEAANRTQLWSNTYDRQLEDLFAVQEEIAEAIVVAFGGEYMRAEWRRVRGRPTDSLDAWGLVLKARAFNLPVNRDAIDEALQLTREAIALDPGYAGAHAALASVLTQRTISNFSADPEADRTAALEAVERAADLAPDDPTVLRTLAKVWSNCGRQDQAVAALRRAVEIAPFDFHSWGRLGRTLCYRGDPASLREGQAVLDRILATAPNHPMVPYWLYFKANACALEERHEDAERFARKSVDIQPGYAGAWVALANALGRLGRTDEAKHAMTRALRANPAMTPQHLAEQIRIAAGGDAQHAERSLAGLKAAGLL